MKKLMLNFLMVLFLGSCLSKKSTSLLPEPKDDEVFLVAQQKFPSITMQEFQKGKNILAVRCTECHGIKKVETRTEQEWLKVIGRMSPKAKLSADEKTALTQYLLSYRELKTSKR
jgi:cytochrome c2